MSVIKNILRRLYFLFNYRKFNPKLDFNEINKVLFIAHPDDELIFFYKTLLESKGWLVVCLTNGRSIIRSKEFLSVMHELNVSYKMLDFKDGIQKYFPQNKLKKAVYRILKKRNKWNMVATHNYQGEYGHTQHIQLNKIVKDVYNGEYIYVPIYKDQLINKRYKLQDREIESKVKLFKYNYKSQLETLTFLEENFKYEAIVTEFIRRKSNE